MKPGSEIWAGFSFFWTMRVNDRPEGSERK